MAPFAKIQPGVHPQSGRLDVAGLILMLHKRHWFFETLARSGRRWVADGITVFARNVFEIPA